MSKENDEFLSLYRTYEGLLRARDADYKMIEEGTNSDRMRIMRQMRNYMAHCEDPEFLQVSPLCLKTLRQMVKEEQLRGDIIKNHLVTPAKGSLKLDTKLSAAVYKLSVLATTGRFEIPVYDDKEKRLKGLIMLEWTAAQLCKQGDITIEEAAAGKYAKHYYLVKPDDPVPENAVADALYYICTKDGTIEGQYMGYLDV